MARRNIGVALEIPEPHRSALQDWRGRLCDPLADRIPPHITLLAPLAVASEDLDAVEEHLRAVAVDEAPFSMVLRGTGTFRPVSPVVFVQVAAGISDCERLERAVRSGPLARELKFNYHPHVTVAQDVDEFQLDRGFRELAGFEAAYDVVAFTLYEQGKDRTWRPLRDFALGTGLPGPAAGA